MVYPSQSVDYLVAGSGETAGSLPTVLRMCKQHRGRVGGDDSSWEEKYQKLGSKFSFIFQINNYNMPPHTDGC
jgi:hypothetical protein